MTQTKPDPKPPLHRLLDWLVPAWTPQQRARTAAEVLRQIGIDTATPLRRLSDLKEKNDMEYSMFGAILEAVAELNREAERVCAGGTLRSEINGVELQKLLDNAKHGVRLLKKIQFASAVPVQNRYLADPEFREAVGDLVRSFALQQK